VAVREPRIPHPLSADENGDGEMTGYVLMVGVLVVFAGILFVVTSNLADQDIRNDTHAAVAQVHGQNQMEFQLIKAGPEAPYELPDEVRVVLDGNECSYSSGDFDVDGPDDAWNVGERLTFDGPDCSGGTLSAFRNYSITITVGGNVVYEDTVRPDP
jgi:hypothetical protein